MKIVATVYLLETCLLKLQLNKIRLLKLSPRESGTSLFWTLCAMLLLAWQYWPSSCWLSARWLSASVPNPQTLIFLWECQQRLVNLKERNWKFQPSESLEFLRGKRFSKLPSKIHSRHPRSFILGCAIGHKTDSGFRFCVTAKEELSFPYLSKPES